MYSVISVALFTLSCAPPDRIPRTCEKGRGRALLLGVGLLDRPGFLLETKIEEETLLGP